MCVYALRWCWWYEMVDQEHISDLNCVRFDRSGWAATRIFIFSNYLQGTTASQYEWRCGRRPYWEQSLVGQGSPQWSITKGKKHFRVSIDVCAVRIKLLFSTFWSIIPFSLHTELSKITDVVCSDASMATKVFACQLWCRMCSRVITLPVMTGVVNLGGDLLFSQQQSKL